MALSGQFVTQYMQAIHFSPFASPKSTSKADVAHFSSQFLHILQSLPSLVGGCCIVRFD